jgi:methylenetetrahydrofolate dehydrogenase (NADP+)/methenyltetrahydrofolate cyclohydrolase
MRKIINGKEIAENILNSIKHKASAANAKPKLAIITYNADERSKLYVGLKIKKAKEVDIEFEVLDWSGKNLDECKAEIQKMAKDDSINGIIAQLPMNGLDNFQEVLNLIPTNKDVDGLSDASLESLKDNKQNLTPATPRAIIEVIKSEQIDLNNKNILIIGQGKLVGFPLSIILKNKGYEVMTADNNTNNLNELTLDADIIISAAGVPKLITGDMIKHDAIVLDAGAAEANGKIVGDVDYESVEPKTSIISKVPGGIGPVTVACLLANTLEASKNSQ